jgi:hypothetical protein
MAQRWLQLLASSAWRVLMSEDQKTIQLTCQSCGHINSRPLPYDMKVRDKCDECGEFNRVATVPDMLREAAGIYEERNKLYGDNYKRFGTIMAALFPDGIARRAGIGNALGETMPEYFNRVGVLIQIISKLTRYCQNFDRGGHPDSLDDLAVYSMMLQELDREVMDRCKAYVHGGIDPE